MQDGPIPNLTVMLSDPQRDLRFMTGTNAAGSFEFTNLPAGELSMEILSPVQSGYRNGGYEPLKTTITIRPDESLQEDIRLRLVLATGWQDRPDIYARPAQTRSPIRRIGTGALRWIAREPLPYPESARDKTTKSIALDVVVGVDGKVISVRGVSADADPDLVRVAITEAGRWTFSPVEIGGQRVEQSGRLEVYFSDAGR
jgi:hypothetical protein